VPLPVTLDDVRAARERIAGRLHRTPLLTSATLSEQVGADVRLKAELLQRTGSFKPRGMLSKLATLTPEEKRRGVISISAGNAAQAIAYCAALEGIDALVVMWQGASEAKVAATRGYGARVDDSATDPTAAFARLDRLVEETGRVLVHPYNDALVIAGHGTLGLELVEDIPDVDVVVVPVGGGGLVSGVTVAVKGLRPEARVVAVEPEGSAALHEALRTGAPVDVVPQTIADGLNAPHAGTNCLELCSVLGVESVLVTEDEIAEAFRFLYERAKLACEPAGAAAASALMAGKIPLEPGQTVAVIVSGGNVSAQSAAAILAGR
jgi:threonine dehydratase